MGAAGRSSKRAPRGATPLALRTSGVALDPELRRHIRGRLGSRLGKLAPPLQRLSVRFKDVNGPRGGVDVACRVKAVITGLPSPVVTELAKSPAAAFERAGQRLERTVRRTIGRARKRGRPRAASG
jgi:hypothetical protein